MGREVKEVSLAEVVDLKAQPITIRIYTMENCAPCRRLKASLNEAGFSYIEQEFSTGKELNVVSAPTLVVFRGNREIARHAGGMDVTELKAFLSATEKL